LTSSAIGKSGVSAVKWSAASTVARFALQLGAQVALARTLGPEAFGLFAIGMVVLTFAGFVSGFGFSWSLLQRVELHDDDVRFAWTWQCAVGVITMVALYFSAPYLAAYFREARAQGVIEWLSIACLLNAASAPAMYLLQRDLNFRAVGLIQVASYALGYLAVGVPMALMGWGVQSLIAAWLVQAAAQFVIGYVLKPHPVKPLLWYSSARLAMGTGRAVFLTNIVNWVLNNLDRILIGRLLNATSLGLYNVAYNLATLPNSVLLGALQPAFTAAGAHLQHDVPRLARAYLQMLATVCVLAFPVFAIFGLMSPDAVAFLYGAQWVDAGWVLGMLFFAMPAYVIWGISTPILWNTQRKNMEFALQLPLIGLGIAGFYLFAGEGILQAAGVAAILLVLRAWVIAAAAFKALDLRLRDVLPEFARGLLLTMVGMACALAAQKATDAYGMPLVSLAAAGGASLAGLVAVVLVWPSCLGEHATAMLTRFFPGLAFRAQRRRELRGGKMSELNQETGL
jgi:lipopolysaccharide exporter